MKDLQQTIDNAPEWAYFYCENNEYYISKDDDDNCCKVGNKLMSKFCKSTEISKFDCITIHQAKQILELQQYRITKQRLIDRDAHNDTIARFVEQTNDTDKPVVIVDLISTKVTYSDVIWMAGEILPYPKLIEFANKVALINIELIQPLITTDDYEKIKSVLNGDTTYVDHVWEFVDKLHLEINISNDTSELVRNAVNAIAHALSVSTFKMDPYNIVKCMNSTLSTSDCEHQVKQLLIEMFDFDS